MLRYYVMAVTRAGGKWAPYVEHARCRLAVLTRELGNDVMRQYVERLKDADGSPVAYEDDMYLSAEPLSCR
jgi:hypothetical protein